MQGFNLGIASIKTHTMYLQQVSSKWEGVGCAQQKLTLQTWHTKLYHSTVNTSSPPGTQIMEAGMPERYKTI